MKKKIDDIVRYLESLQRDTIAPADLHAAAADVTERVAPLGLYRSRLSLTERRSLGAQTSSNTALIIAEVADGMAADPEAYQDLPFSGARLQAAFAEAEAAERLWACLSSLAAQAHDHHLALLADCGDAARRAIRTVQTTPITDPELHARRVAGLGAAPLRLAGRHSRSGRTRRSRAKASQPTP